MKITKLLKHVKSIEISYEIQKNLYIASIKRIAKNLYVVTLTIYDKNEILETEISILNKNELKTYLYNKEYKILKIN